MLTIPIIEDYPAQPYALISFVVPMSEMKRPADEGFPALFGWLAQHDIKPVGAPFYNYRRIDMARTLEVEAGVPADHAGAEEDDRIKFGELPAGKYVCATHTGHYNQLYGATAMLIGWARERGIAWDMRTQPDGDHFACRLEIYETDPTEQPDPGKWVTRLRFKIAD
ncbi:MAG: GyrI-like domain-containing protein [Devosia sp.]